MKNRRLTILCLAVITLVGTPRAWQEISKVLAFVQHKAQVKFWSMVLEPKNDDGGDVQMVKATLPSGGNGVEVASNCPFEREEWQRNPVSRGSQTERRIVSPRVRPASVREKVAVAPASLIAKALKTPRETGSSESLGHVRSVAANDQPRYLESTEPSLLSVSVGALPLLPQGKAEAFKFVMMPVANPIVSMLAEKETFVQLKLIKKSIEENRQSRPKPCPKVRIPEFGLRI